MPYPKILAFAGATRSGSFNKKLIRVGAGLARDGGCEVTLIDLRDYPMPLYDGDLEAADGLPEQARALKTLMLASDGFLLSCPEYNGSITAVLKNAIDWLSRPRPDEPNAFKGRIAGLLAASPGNLGGVRALLTVRQVLTTLGVVVVPTQFALSQAGAAFTEDGSLKEARQHEAVKAVVSQLIEVTSALRRPP
jgi:chromate reductase, NAD(P)H dehydrogenase (quinone)